MTKITKNIIEFPVVLNKSFVNGKEHWAVNCEALNIFVVGGTPRSVLVLYANKLKMLKNKDLEKLLG